MSIMIEWMGLPQLAKELQRKSETDFKQVEAKNLLQLRNRAVSSSSPSQGGTPVDTAELRLSASTDLNRGIFGYTKDYALSGACKIGQKRWTLSLFKIKIL